MAKSFELHNRINAISVTVRVLVSQIKTGTGPTPDQITHLDESYADLQEIIKNVKKAYPDAGKYY